MNQANIFHLNNQDKAEWQHNFYAKKAVTHQSPNLKYTTEVKALKNPTNEIKTVVKGERRITNIDLEVKKFLNVKRSQSKDSKVVNFSHLFSVLDYAKNNLNKSTPKDIAGITGLCVSHSTTLMNIRKHLPEDIIALIQNRTTTKYFGRSHAINLASAVRHLDESVKHSIARQAYNVYKSQNPGFPNATERRTYFKNLVETLTYSQMSQSGSY